MRIERYEYPRSFEEAFALMESEHKSVLMAGGMYLRLQERRIPLAIDLGGLGLDHMTFTEDGCVVLGAMCNLRTIETDIRLPAALRQSVRQIGGVALRNMVTIGGSVMGRYPFSDVTTALVALGTELTFHRNGTIPIEDFLEHGLKERDILVSVKVKGKRDFPQAFSAFKPVHTDFAVLNLCIVVHGNEGNCDDVFMAIGARPHRSRLIRFDSDALLKAAEDSASMSTLLNRFDFDTDARASGTYRRALAEALFQDVASALSKVLVERGMRP